jgi:hypothetical protein
MTRAIFLALLLSACGSYEFAEEIGAPPRPWPAGMTLSIDRVPEDALPQKAQLNIEQGGRLKGFTVLAGRECFIQITDEDIPRSEYERILTHEKRHCTGQQHELKRINGKRVLVWLP